jgi:putative transposase
VADERRQVDYRKAAHTTFALEYHIVFCTKYRYRVLTGDLKERLRNLISQICRSNSTKIISGHIAADYVHLFVSVPPAVSIAQLMQAIKGKTSRLLQLEFKQLGKSYWNSHLWAKGYFASTVGGAADAIKSYIAGHERRGDRDEDDAA